MFHQDASRPATTARIRRASKQGNVPKSRELVSVAVWLAGLAALATFMTTSWKLMHPFAQHHWGQVQWQAAEADAAQSALLSTGHLLSQTLAPFLLTLALMVLMAHLTQTQFRWFPARLQPDVSRLSPRRYLQKLFSLESLAPPLTGMIKLGLLAGVGIWVLWGESPGMLMLSLEGLDRGFPELMDQLLRLGFKLGLAMLVVGLVDYGMQWWLHRRELRMTDQDLRDEERLTEPAPEIGARQRLFSRQLRDQSGGRLLPANRLNE